MFVHQDGVLLTTTLRALAGAGLLEPSLDAERPVTELIGPVEPEGFGYMRVGLRCLASQGWLADTPALDPRETVLRWTATGRHAMRHLDSYVAAGELLARFPDSDRDAWARPWSAAQTEAFLALLPAALDRWRLSQDLPPDLAALVTTHLDAGLTVPAMLSLGARGGLGAEAPALPAGRAGEGIAALLAGLGWTGGDGRWMPAGREAAGLSVHFGMAASYLPLLSRLPELYRGELSVQPAPGEPEWHVHRGLNVIASGAAHTRYFNDADGIFREIFDREPLDAQPRFIADMGCGDGSWLVHLHELISSSTLRGRHAVRHPLLMVGLDLNEAALAQARELLDAAGVPALLALGDVSDPDGVRDTLARHGLAMEDGLHVRAFIDHNRAYAGTGDASERPGLSDAAYVGPHGRPLDPGDVEQDLVAHLRRWAPHVRRHGLVMLEAHSVAPRVARQHLGATHSVAFDAYHGYSHQYPIEHAAFQRCCAQAGVRPATDRERRYPATRPFVAVSLNHLLVPGAGPALPASGGTASRPDGWAPEANADTGDGRALHELLYEGGELGSPRLWCSAATGFVVSQALDAVEARLASAREGDVIRVLDYGAGTGLASIELLAACGEREVERRLAEAGATLELHLVDLPSSWFAQGYALLRDCAWVRFHSLAASGGGFKPLIEMVGEGAVDAVMANMVFHLVPPVAMERAARELAAITRRGGRLAWSSPDLGPPGPFAVLFHDPNRELRARWLELLGTPPGAFGGDVSEAVRTAREGMDAAAMRAAAARAARRVLPRANSAHDVHETLAAAFGGAAALERPTYELPAGDVVDTLLVPSNQGEFLSEIEDPDLRARVIRELMEGDVLPRLQAGPAGTAVGLNVQWTLGAVWRR